MVIVTKKVGEMKKENQRMKGDKVRLFGKEMSDGWLKKSHSSLQVILELLFRPDLIDRKKYEVLFCSLIKKKIV